MKLQKIKLQGFIGLHKGLGVESINLDLSGLSGLISIEGDNGMGKTTLLENLHPFRTLPSRKTALKRHVFLKNSQKDLTFAMNGDIYRCLVKMDPTTTRGDEGYIWKNEVSEVDGKVSNYDQYLFDLLGSQNLFFNSIFCAQNSAKLSDMRPAELKALFAEFLRLDRYIQWEETSKLARNYFIAGAENVFANLKKTETAIKMLGDPRADLVAAGKVDQRLNIEFSEAEKKIGDLEAALEVQKGITMGSLIATEKMLAARKERERIEKEQADIFKQMTEIADEGDQEGQDILKQIEELKVILEEKESIEAASLAASKAEAQISAVDKALGDFTVQLRNMRTGLETKQKQVGPLVLERSELKADTRVRHYTMKMDGVNNEITALTARLDNITEEPELIKLDQKIKTMKESAAVLDTIDPGCTSEICGLITKSLDDKKNLPGAHAEYSEAKRKIKAKFLAKAVDLRKQIDDLTALAEKVNRDIIAQVADRTKQIDELNDSISLLQKGIKDTELEMAVAQDERKALKTKMNAEKEVAAKQSQIVIAQTRIKDLEIQLANVHKRVAANQASLNKTESRLAAEFAKATADIADHQKKIDENAEKDLARDEKNLAAAQKELEEIKLQITKNDQTIEVIHKEIAQLEQLEAEVKDIRELHDYHRVETTRWNYLVQACSKDGLRALEIEGVAPVITGYANEMLSSTFGPNHSVRFETQDEDGREVLNIVVIGDDGSETLLTNLSGGERVWILKALSLAQTLISQEKSGRHFQTALMDEEDGALSNDNAIRFIQLYNTLMDMAKMDACFFISHRPDAISMADYRIRLKKGGIQIR